MVALCVRSCFLLLVLRTLFQCFDYSATCESVAIGVDSFAHGVVMCLVIEQCRYFGYNLLVVGAYELDGAGFECLGTLCGVAHNKYGFAKARCLFLNTTAVG